ncbi:MAG: YdcF family protein [Candidatus Diapherotrites archaeon]
MKNNVAIVRGWYVRPDGKLDFASRKRLELVKELFRSGECSKIILSGGINRETFWKGKRVTESAMMRDYLVDELGVPSSLLLIESDSRGLTESAINTKKMVDELDPEKVFVITNDFAEKEVKDAFLRNGFSESKLVVKGADLRPRRLRDVPGSFFWTAYGKIVVPFKRSRWERKQRMK